MVENMGKKKPRPHGSFTPDFKAEIVELCRRGDRSVAQAWIQTINPTLLVDGWNVDQMGRPGCRTR
ncbi:hypothetical protein GCM10009733_021610 [Nonomuraea maheshkhaliensis]|uniref:Transposase n=1 Tax=Nonomuraea maheshkhaliensis TaxID=419590 RepID=A0ABP4QVD0_9ACTN